MVIDTSERACLAIDENKARRRGKPLQSFSWLQSSFFESNFYLSERNSIFFFNLHHHIELFCVFETLPSIFISYTKKKPFYSPSSHSNRSNIERIKDERKIYNIRSITRRKALHPDRFSQKVYWHAVDCSIQPTHSKASYHIVCCFSSSSSSSQKPLLCQFS